jgi:hypothetical protein
MKDYKFDGYRDRYGKLIKEGMVVRVFRSWSNEHYYADYSIVTKYKKKLIIFGKYLSAWIFIANDNFKCPFLEVYKEE